MNGTRAAEFLVRRELRFLGSSSLVTTPEPVTQAATGELLNDTGYDIAMSNKDNLSIQTSHIRVNAPTVAHP
jgi:hypothetical protein